MGLWSGEGREEEGRGAAFGFNPTRSEPCGFGATYEELASAVREEYPDIEIESRLGGTGELRGGRLRGGFGFSYGSTGAPGGLWVFPMRKGACVRPCAGVCLCFPSLVLHWVSAPPAGGCWD